MKKTAYALTLTWVLTISLMFGVQFVQVVESQSTFIDNFDSTTLGSEWQAIDPSGGSTFNLSANSGWLQINTTSPPDRKLTSSVVNSPRIMMQGVNGDFTVETKVNASMNQSEVSVGILIWKNNTHFIKLEKLHSLSPVTYYRQGQDIPVYTGIRFEMYGGNSWSNGEDINPIYLRIVREGDLCKAYYGPYGQSIGTLVFDVDGSVDVGLYVTSVGYNGTFSAEFDYFKIDVRPTPSPTPTASPAPSPTASPHPVPITSPTPTPTPKEEPQSTEQDMTVGAVFAVASILVFLGLLLYLIKRK